MKTVSNIFSLVSVIFALLVGDILILNRDTESLQVNNQVIDIAYQEANETTEEIEPVKKIVYDNMTLDELANKINKSLNSTIAGYGYLYASYALEKGVDPYLAVAISLHETGCAWDCSNLVKACNNVGGQKGNPGCNGGSYKAFDTLEDGIKAFIDNLATNYISKGLTTPESMNSYYSESSTWAKKVNVYIEKIREQ